MLLPWSNDAWDMKSYRWNRLGPLEASLLWGPLDSTTGWPTLGPSHQLAKPLYYTQNPLKPGSMSVIAFHEKAGRCCRHMFLHCAFKSFAS